MKNENTEIDLDDFSCRCYEFLLENKEFRAANVLKVLLLRKDFQNFLFRLDAEHLKMSKDGALLLCKKDDSISETIEEYLHSVVKSEYFKEESQDELEYFIDVGVGIIEELYLEHSMDIKSYPSLSLEFKIWSKETTYPNISKRILYKSDSLSRRNDEILHAAPDALRKHLVNDIEILIAPFLASNGNEPKRVYEPKVCEIIFDDTTEKEEVLSYIRNNWDQISEALKVGRPEPRRQRMSNDRNFLRNVKIFNQYEALRVAGKNPHVKLQSWLLKPENGGIQLDANTIMNIISEMRCGLKEINE